MFEPPLIEKGRGYIPVEQLGPFVRDLVLRVERLEVAARKVLADWKACQSMQGQVIHTCNVDADDWDDETCGCTPHEAAPKWASLTELERLFKLDKER